MTEGYLGDSDISLDVLDSDSLFDIEEADLLIEAPTTQQELVQRTKSYRHHFTLMLPREMMLQLHRLHVIERHREITRCHE